MVIVQSAPAFIPPHTILMRIRERNGQSWDRRYYLCESLDGVPSGYKLLHEIDDIKEAITTFMGLYNSNLSFDCKEIHFMELFKTKYKYWVQFAYEEYKTARDNSAY